MKIRKLMFVLPNLFTITSILCGFYAMTLCAREGTPSQLYQAALAIFFAMFFDGFDGRVARLTKTQSDFGIELDSLADVISFGAAPALLVYKWALLPLGFAIRGLLVHSVSGALVLVWFATMVFFLGLLVGPYVVYGSAPKRRKPTSGTRARVTGADRRSGRDGTGRSDGTDLHSAR